MKGIIVVDIPECCNECERCIDGLFGGFGCTVNGKFISVNGSDKKTKPYWCPIKQIPEKMDIDACSAQQRYITTGYNACIDEILKGAENGQEQATDR